MLVQTVGSFTPATSSGSGAAQGDLPAVSQGTQASSAGQVSNGAVQPGQTAGTTPSVEAVQQAADHINKALRTLTSNALEFTVDQDSGRTVVKVVDVGTKDVIRQIPSEETLSIARALDRLQGLLIKHEA
jgi:flagellar protein FlaG